MISYANSVKNRPIFAERAQNDAAGNEIGRTYATKAEVPTVDQTYDATSTNAQSGVAVAQAIAAIPQTGGGSDEWWSDPGVVWVNARVLRLQFKDTTFDPRNDPDSSFLAKFTSITKVSDGVFDLEFKDEDSLYYQAFSHKYQADKEFIIVAFNYYNAGVWRSMGQMFSGCTGLRAVYNFGLQGISNGTEAPSMFSNCTNLVYFSMQNNAPLNNAFDLSHMFNGCSSLRECNMCLTCNSSNVVNTTYRMFLNCKKLVHGAYIACGINDAREMFAFCNNLVGSCLTTATNLVNGMLPETNCNAQRMYSGCYSLQYVDIDFVLINRFSRIDEMFTNCVSIQSIPQLKLGSSVNADYAFDGCRNLQNLPVLDYGSITSATLMFYMCYGLKDISTLATVTWNASLASVSEMFEKCYAIETGLLAVYTNMANTATISTHFNTFTDCGVAYSNPDLAQIPSAWGGGGA